jgi:hypothetical protein
MEAVSHFPLAVHIDHQTPLELFASREYAKSVPIYLLCRLGFRVGRKMAERMTELELSGMWALF